jgi:pyridoxamine 5'-phosphate oxidase
MEITNSQNPISLFKDWLREAEASEPNDPNAMTLATVGQDLMPSARMVLLKDVTDKGFTFYTNSLSQKGQELALNPKAALCFHWKSLLRQVRVQGAVEFVSEAEADAYFNSRHPISRLGANISKQSQVLGTREELVLAVKSLEESYLNRENEIPRPKHWRGYRVIPMRIEFWQQGDYRLHDRFLFERRAADSDEWQLHRLYP